MATTLSAPQARALAALVKAHRSAPGQGWKAVDLGLAGGTLGSLVRLGLARNVSPWQAQAMGHSASYRITLEGMKAAQAETAR